MNINEPPDMRVYSPAGPGQLISFILFSHSKIAHAHKSGIGVQGIGCSCEDGFVHGLIPHFEMVGLIIDLFEEKGNKKFWNVEYDFICRQLHL